MQRRPLTLLIGFASFAAACGDDGMMMMPPDPPTSVLYAVSDPCTAKAPLPNDILRDANGQDERAACAPPSDPIEAALQAALADEGAALDSMITIPFEGTGVDLGTLTASASFSLVPSSTVAPTGALPPTIIIGAAKNSTLAADYSIIQHTASVSANDEIELVLGEALKPGWFYVAITTDSIKDLGRPQKPLAQSPAVKALVGMDTIVEGAFEGADAASVARLERERQKLAPVLALLAGAEPAIPAAKIRSIQSFTAALGFQRLLRAADAYHEAITMGRITYSVEAGGELAPADVYPMGTPASAYAQVQSFKKGTIAVPKVLDENGYMRPDWTTNVQTIRVPFLISIPRGGGGYRLAIYLPGFLHSKQDARILANDFAGAPRAAVMGIDLRCHGDRSLDSAGLCKDERTPAEVTALTDTNSNGNPERTGPDGVPDNSGAGFFDGNARKLRDGQLASIIEVMHIVESAQRGASAFMAAGIITNPTEVHLVAHGHAAQIAVGAAAITRAPVRTLSMPSGGASTKQLVLDGPAPIKDHFNMTLPAGVTPAMNEMYLDRLEATVLKSIAIDETGRIANERLVRASPGGPRMLIAHGARAQHVSADARMALISATGLASVQRVSAHNGECDDFYLHQCALGDNVAWGERAREQLATYLGSGGVTVLSPAP